MSDVKPLATFAGRAVTPDLARDLAHLAELPADSRGELWLALEPTLTEPVPSHAEPMIESFRRKWRVDGPTFTRALKAARFFLRAASGEDIPRQIFLDDMRTLLTTIPASGPSNEDRVAAVEACLLPYYEAAKARIRSELIARTM